jgi:hypothetical protein
MDNKIEHLKNLGEIIKEFIVKYNFNRSYLSITGVVRKTTYSRLTISVIDEFDDLTIKKVKGIESEIYESLREYLDKNNIDDGLIIRDSPSRGWYKDGIDLVFETIVKI